MINAARFDFMSIDGLTPSNIVLWLNACPVVRSFKDVVVNWILATNYGWTKDCSIRTNLETIQTNYDPGIYIKQNVAMVMRVILLYPSNRSRKIHDSLPAQKANNSSNPQLGNELIPTSSIRLATLPQRICPTVSTSNMAWLRQRRRLCIEPRFCSTTPFS